MTRQAAPPAQRWLLLMISLLVASWLGQGVAGAYTMGVDPQSGRPGTTVTVTLKDFLAACVVLFDNEQAADPVIGCEDTSVTFVIPSDATTGAHEIRAVGQGAGGEIAEQVMTFRVTSGGAIVTQPTGSSVPGPITGEPPAEEDPAAVTTTVSQSPAPVRPTTSIASTAPASTARAVTAPPSTSAPAGFAATCPPRQVALMRFDVTPVRGRPGTNVAAGIEWGDVGACTEVRALQALFDGEAVGPPLPVAGTLESFEITIPDDASDGSHRFSVVVADDPSIELASQALQVDRPTSTVSRLAPALIVAGVLLLLAVFGMVRRLRRRKAFVKDLAGTDDGWAGMLDPPDVTAPPADVSGFGLSATATATATAPQPDATAVGIPDAGATVAGVTAAMAVAVEDNPTMPVVPLVVTSGRDGSYYLLERQNAHAPRRANGKRGWYRTQRLTPVRGILGRTVDPHTAGAAASELATGELPVSASVVIDVDGALELLPDDLVAFVGPASGDPIPEDAVLIMLLAGFGADPATDQRILGHAGAWLASRMTAHGIPPRPVTPAEFHAGVSGLVSEAATFPWPRMLALAAQPPPAGGQEAPPDAAPPTPVPAPLESIAPPPAPPVPPPPVPRPLWSHRRQSRRGRWQRRPRHSGHSTTRPRLRRVRRTQ